MTLRRGSFLIGVLLIATAIAMFAVSALALAPAGLQRSLHLARRQSAERAISSGIQYAIARIRATPGGLWRASAPYQFRQPGLIVDEGEGQVVGWVQEGDRWSRFRLSFNAQDGPGGHDGLNDPSQPLTDLPGRSLNNLPFNYEIASGGGQTVPPHCLLLSLDGLSGNVALGAQGTPANFLGAPSRLRTEVLLALSNQNLQLFDSVASATGNLDFTVQAGQSVRFDALGSGQARLRAKVGLEVRQSNSQGGTLTSSAGELRTPNHGNQIGATQVAPVIGRQQENSGDAFYSIALDSAPQPGAGSVQLAAGVYEFDLVQGQPKVMFYEMSYADYKSRRLAGTLTPGTEVTLDPAIELNVLDRDGQDVLEVHFSKDASVQPNSVDGLALVPAKGAFQEGEVPQLQAQASPPAAMYLADLAQAIDNQISSTPPTNEYDTNNDGYNDHANYTSPVNITQSFLDVIYGYTGSHTGNFNLAGAQFSYNFLQFTTINNFETSYDGLGSHQFRAGALELAQHFWANSQGYPDRLARLGTFVGSPPPTDFGSGPPPNVGFAGPDPTPAPSGTPAAGGSSGLAVKDLKVRLEGDSEETASVTLRGAGDIVLAGMLEGKGGAVVAGGDLSLLGNGVDLEAAQEASSVNLYSCGNILIDGFAFDDSSSRYNSLSLKGVMYAWGDITINAGKLGSSLPWAGFDLSGAMVAFGRDPSASGQASARNIRVLADHCNLTFDPLYLLNLEESPVDANSSFLVRAFHQK